MMKKINIGITINIDKPTESFFTNGLKQNAITFLETFLKCENVNNAYFINLGPQKDLSQSPWKAYEKHIINFNEAVEKVDLAVTVAVTFTNEMLEILHKKGVRIAKHVLGSEYHFFVESMLFGRSPGTSFKKRNHHSAVWLSPHIYPTGKDLFEVVCKCPAYSAPFVWSPKFLEHDVEIIKKTSGISGIYEPKEAAKKVSVFEPNLNAVKTSLTPIITGEKFYLKSPELVKKISIFCANEIKNNGTLVEFVTDLEVQKNKKIFFESRYGIVWSLFNHTDIVLSHQRDLALNYLYFDAAWLGFPVVHNAHFVKELGYYYEDFDAEQAANLLVDVAKNFDATKDEYLVKSREYISKFLPDHPRNVKGYEILIENATT